MAGLAALASDVSRATIGLLILSLAAFLAVWALTSTDYVTLPICGPATDVPARVALASLWLQLTFVRLPELVFSLGIMIIAMMAPTLSGPMLHLWHRSLARHRWRAIGLFAAGYLAVWIVACGVLFIFAQIARNLVNNSTALFLVCCCVALLWQISSAKRYCLQRCHLRPSLSIFGARALVDPLVFGLTSGCWCVATCWAWMLVPFSADYAQNVLMAVVGVIAVAERSVWREARRRPASLRAWFTSRIGLRSPAPS